MKAMAKRMLTSGEIALARGIFGDSVDYARVRIHDKRIFPGIIQKKGRAMAGHNAVSFPGTTSSADFSKEDGVRQALFIHEMVHVWQHQTGAAHTYRAFAREMLRSKFNYDAAYQHRLERGRDLMSYNFEQQACIIQDYFALTWHGIRQSHRGALLNEPWEDLPGLYLSVLKKFLRNPSYARGYARQKKPPFFKGRGL